MLTEEQHWQRFRFLMGREHYRYYQIMMEGRFDEIKTEAEWEAGDAAMARIRDIYRTDKTFRQFYDTRRAAA